MYNSNIYYVYYISEYVNICNRESLNTGKGEIARLSKEKKKRKYAEYPLHILTHRNDTIVASANKNNTRAIRIFYIYKK